MAELKKRQYEFVGGPWDGLGAPVNHQHVFYDPTGHAHILARWETNVIGDYQLDTLHSPPVWRWTRTEPTEES